MDLLERLAIALEENAAEMKLNTAELKKITSQMGGSAKAKTEPETKAKAEPETKAKEDAGRGRGRPAKEEKAKVEKVSSADLKKVAEDFLDVEGDEIYKERRSVVKAVADYFKAEKFSAIEDAADRVLAKKIIETAKAGENVDPDDIQATVDDLEGSLDAGSDEGKGKSSRRNDDV